MAAGDGNGKSARIGPEGRKEGRIDQTRDIPNEWIGKMCFFECQW